MGEAHIVIKSYAREASSIINGHFVKGQEVGRTQIPANHVSGMAFE